MAEEISGTNSPTSSYSVDSVYLVDLVNLVNSGASTVSSFAYQLKEAVIEMVTQNPFGCSMPQKS